jgi:hypothetical protein
MEPPGTPKFQFTEPTIDGVLVNLEAMHMISIEDEFVDYMDHHRDAKRQRITPVRYRLLFRPIVALINTAQVKDLMIQSLGGEVVGIEE